VSTISVVVFKTIFSELRIAMQTAADLKMDDWYIKCSLAAAKLLTHLVMATWEIVGKLQQSQTIKVQMSGPNILQSQLDDCMQLCYVLCALDCFAV